ncbi:MAG: hypothetical protein F2923_02255 [Actinobacteria bacterium]|uniref:Unannotated protein n=1 Tax=freshwater metagenome TaxID=449393 RepID=A0A6J7S5J0_9ZZZZ|nr:hypothetical protein [Actinomycetota bacterium]MTB27443.1 hypothetical protein [Actinomycetota bacterium]
MNSARSQRLRAEHPSVGEYLTSVLTQEQRQNVLLSSFNQWDFAQAALADIALCLRDLGSEVTLAFWSGRTPLHDVGWTTSRRASALLRSPGRDDRVKAALIASGLSDKAFAQPPIRRWHPVDALSFPEILNRTSIRAMEYRGTAVGRAILQVHPDTETPVTDDFLWPKKWVEATSKSYAYVYDQILQLIDERGITAIIVYNGRFLHDRAAAAAAETRGLPVLNYDMGGSHTDFDLTIDATHDWDALQRRMLKLYNEWPADERDELGSSWFLERVNHEDPMNSLFVEAQKKGSKVELPAAECTVVYFSSSGDEIAELELDWDAYFAGQNNALKVLADECRKRPGYSLVVRSHPHKRIKPKQDVDEWMEAVELAHPDLHLDPFADADSYELMRQADIVVTYGSTTGVEAAFARKPVIVMGPCAYDKLGCAIGVATIEELSQALQERNPGSWPGAVSYGLMMKRRGFTYQFVEKNNRGLRSLGAIEFSEANKTTLDISHALNRLERWRLTREK